MCKIQLLIFCFQISGVFFQDLTSNPPHCTTLTKSTDYVSKYKFQYPVAYIPPGQHEAYQQMYCVNPAAVSRAEAVVCDWTAPPDVQFTLGDQYLHVVRQDPTNRFIGNVVITTMQVCSHTIPPHFKHIVNDSVSNSEI